MGLRVLTTYSVHVSLDVFVDALGELGVLQAAGEVFSGILCLLHPEREKATTYAEAPRWRAWCDASPSILIVGMSLMGLIRSGCCVCL